MEKNEIESSSSAAENSPAATGVAQSISEAKTKNSNMLILTAEDILKTYPEKEAESARKYYEFLKLKEENPTFGYKKLAKMLTVPIHLTRGWKQWNCKPISITAIEKLTQIDLLPLYLDNPKLPAILRLLGASFTDGGIDKNINTFHFNSAVKTNINKWKDDFDAVFPFAKESISYIATGQYKSSIGARTCDRSVIRLFAALGCPVGNKTMVSYTLPTWIFELTTKLKLAFIDGFFSCEVAMPQCKNRGINSWHFVNFSLSMSKIEEKEIEHLEFLKALCMLCENVGLKYTSIKRVPQPTMKKGNIRRKDGKICDSYRILFSAESENVLLAHKLIPLTYAVEKKQRFDNAVKTYRQRHSGTTIKTEDCSINVDAKNYSSEDNTEESIEAEAMVL